MSARKDKGRDRQERYVKLRYWLLNSQAWNSLSGHARALYVELAQRYNGSNNGRIPYSVREAVRALHVSQGIAHHLLGILQDRGFVICTKRGAFSLKTTKDASEWALTEYDCDHPPAHATKDFMRWNGDFETMSQFRERKGECRPKMTDLDKERARRLQSKTRFTAMTHTVHSHEPYGSQQRPMKSKKRQNGSQQRPIDAQNDPPTVHSHEHLQLPGRGCEPGVLLLFPEGEPAEKKPWSTPTVEEVPWDTLPTKVRMLVLGLPDAGLPPQVDAVVDVPHQVETQPPVSPDVDRQRHSREGLMTHVAEVIEEQLRNLDEAWKAKREAAAKEKQPVEPPAQPISAPGPVPARPMLPGDLRRAEIRARNQEVVERDNAKMRAGLH